jgi:hypothetical protein
MIYKLCGLCLVFSLSALRETSEEFTQSPQRFALSSQSGIKKFINNFNTIY